MNRLYHLVLIFLLVFISLPFLLQVSAQARLCGGDRVAQDHCRSAADILRKLLAQQDDEIGQKSDKPLPPVVIVPDKAKPIKSNQASIIYLPFPTPRPAYKRPIPVISSTQFPKAAAGIDPTTTAGIFARCLDANKIKEPDIRAQRRILRGDTFCITEKKLTENGLDWRLYIIKNKKRKSGPLFVVPHDNEDSAFAAGVYGLQKYGGTLVAVEAGEERFFKGQDPNRNFGTNRATAKRCRMQRAPAPKYTRAVLKSRKRGQPIIALHSNANGWSGNGGKGNISIRRKGGALPFVSAVARSRRLADEDTLIVVASTKPPSKDRRLSKKVKYFTEKAGVNVLYEHVSAKKNDCSLSNYVALKRLGVYFNVEVETGDVRTQKKVLDIVMKSLR